MNEYVVDFYQEHLFGVQYDDDGAPSSYTEYVYADSFAVDHGDVFFYTQGVLTGFYPAALQVSVVQVMDYKPVEEVADDDV